MAFCAHCGSNITDGVTFCPQCGATVGAAAAPPPPPPYSAQPPYGAPPPPPYGATPPPYAPYQAAPASGLQENVAAFLSYLLGWLTGIIFLLIDKRPFVRFHAAQSIVVFGALFLFRIILIFAFVGGGFMGGMWAITTALSLILSLVTLAAWIGLMIVAYQGKNFEVPIAAGIARSIIGKV